MATLVNYKCRSFVKLTPVHCSGQERGFDRITSPDNPLTVLQYCICLIFGNIAILTTSSTLISKIIVAKLNSYVKMAFWDISL